MFTNTTVDHVIHRVFNVGGVCNDIAAAAVGFFCFFYYPRPGGSRRRGASKRLIIIIIIIIIIFCVMIRSHLFRMGRRQLVVDQPRHRPEHGPSVLVGIRVRFAVAVVRVPQVLRGQDQLHAAKAVQPHVQAPDQGGQVRPELLRVGRGPREADGQQRRPAQLLPVPQVSRMDINIGFFFFFFFPLLFVVLFFVVLYCLNYRGN